MQKQIKERPILFSGPMIDALRAGRKTQARRVIKQSYNGCFTDGGPHPCPIDPLYVTAAEWQAQHPNAAYADRWMFACSTLETTWLKCPYGMPGDRLWVKESFVRLDPTHPDGLWRYKADVLHANYPFTSPLFMPRAASRILLEVVRVQVERVQQISEADAVAEGIYWAGSYDGYVADSDGRCYHGSSAVRSYEKLWVSINGPGSLDSDPWVWVVEFKVIEPAATPTKQEGNGHE